MITGTMDVLEVLWRSLLEARSIASSNAAAAVAGLFRLEPESDVAIETFELLVSESRALAYSRFFVAIAVCVCCVCDGPPSISGTNTG